jgi:multiple sugar transport system substrate-binding protein
MFARGARVYAFPKGFSPMVMYYNRAMFDRAKVPYPSDGWTQAEFLQTAKALTRDTNGDGQPDEWGAVVLRLFYEWQAWVWSAGGDILAPDGKHATGALDSPATDSAISFLTGLDTREHVAPKPNAFRAVSGMETRLFFSGKLAMLPSGHWLIPNIKQELAAGNLRLGVTSTPRAPDVVPSTPLFASAWAVPRNTSHRKLAVELAAALAGVEAQRTRLAAGLELSAMPAIQEAFAARDTLGLEPAFLRQVPFGRPPWGATIARYREVEALLPEIIDRIVIKGEAVHTVTSDVAHRIDEVLAR